FGVGFGGDPLRQVADHPERQARSGLTEAAGRGRHLTESAAGAIDIDPGYGASAGAIEADELRAKGHQRHVRREGSVAKVDRVAGEGVLEHLARKEGAKGKTVIVEKAFELVARLLDSCRRRRHPCLTSLQRYVVKIPAAWKRTT